MNLSYSQILKNGVIDENPVFVQVIGLCPLFAVTTTAMNGLMMGLVTTMVMICACVVISFVRKFVPAEIRIAASVVIIACFVTILQFLLDAYASPTINDSLGIFIPLIVVNCVVFSRVEAFASKNKPAISAYDAFSYGIGFTIGLLSVGIIRELLGSGTFFDFEVLPKAVPRALVMIMAPGAFFTLGFIMMVIRYYRTKKKGRAEA